MIRHFSFAAAVGLVMCHLGQVFANEPINDDFANRIALTSDYAVAVGYNFGADPEAGEPFLPTNDQRTVWYGFTPPAEGSLLATVTGSSSFNPQLSLFRGAVLVTLTNLGNFGIVGSTVASFRQDVIGGSNYAMRVDSFTNRAEGDFTLVVDFKADPPNDNFTDRTIFGGNGGVLSGEYNFGADPEAGEPLHPTNDQRTVWYEFTPAVEGSLLATVTGSGGFNPLLTLFRGSSLVTLTNLGRFGNTASTTAAFRQDVIGGSNYALQVDSFTNRAEGVFTVNVDFDPDPTNDNFAARTIMGGGSGVITNEDIFGADAEVGEPFVPTNDQRSVWYGFTAPTNGSLLVHVNGHLIFAPSVAFYRGEVLATLTNLGHFGNALSEVVSLRQDVIGGSNYAVQVDAFTNRSENAFTVTYDFDADPSNDIFAARTLMVGSGVITNEDNFGADEEAGEPFVPTNDQRSVWYGFTAPTDGSLFVHINGHTIFPPSVAFYRGEVLATLTNLGHFGNALSEVVSFRQDVIGGSNYAMQVDSFTNRSEMVFTVTFDFDPDPSNDNFAARTILVGSGAVSNEDNFGADEEVGELFVPTNDQRTVWYGMTPGTEGSLAMTVVGLSGFAPQLALFRGDALGTLTNLGNFGNAGSTVAAFRQNVSGGSNYAMRVDSFTNRAEGAFTVNFDFDPDPDNDDFVNRTVITNADIVLGAEDNFGADPEVGEPFLPTNNQHTVWYGFTPAVDGSLLVSVNGGGAISPQLSLFRGNTLATLTNLGNFGNAGSTVASFRQDLTGGSNYAFRVDSFTNRAEGIFVLTFAFDTDPSNDNFAARTMMVGGGVITNEDNYGADAEAGEPFVPTNDQRSVWYGFTAPTNGSLFVHVNGHSIYPPSVAFYRGDALVSLTNLGHFGNSLSTTVSFRQDVIGGSNYAVQVDSFTNRSEMVFTVTYDFKPDPPNDECTNRTVIGGTGGVLSNQYNFGADPEAGETFLPTNQQRTVWYGYTPAVEGSLLMTVTGSNGFAPQLALFRGEALATLTNLGNFGNAGSTVASFRQDVSGGSNYVMRVDSFTNRAEGLFMVTLDFDADPTNDNFASRTVIPNTGAVLSAEDNFGADPEVGELFLPTNDQRTVWYGITPAVEGSLQVSVTGSGGFAPQMSFYRGNSLVTLTNLGNFGNAGSTVASFRQDLIGGSNYIIRVDSFTNRAEGVFTLTISFEPDPPNDDFANATIFGGAGGILSNEFNFGADVEGAEIPPNTNTASRSVWYKWIAPGEGSLLVTVDGDGAFEPQVQVARGSTLGTLSNLFVTSVFGGSTLVSFRTDVQGGTNYFVRVDGRFNFSFKEGTFTVRMDADLPRPANDNFDNAFGIVGATMLVKGRNNQCTKEVSEPNHNAGAGGASAWWEWTAPFPGSATLNLRTTGFTAHVAIYTGTVINVLYPIAGMTAATGTMTWATIAGTTYRIAIDGQSGATGLFDFDLLAELSLLQGEFVESTLTSEMYRTEILGASGGSYMLQRSTNLFNWFNTSILVPGMDGTVIFNDLLPTNAGPRFYRLMGVP